MTVAFSFPTKMEMDGIDQGRISGGFNRTHGKKKPELNSRKFDPG
jgi:hypothetical protein